MSKLNSLIEALPQELKDVIFDFAFPPIDEAQTILIEATYRPPLQLSLTPALRSASTDPYFTTSTFTFSNPSLGTSWLASLPKDHLELLKHIEYDPLLPATVPGQGGLEFMPICAERIKLTMLKRSIAQAMGGWRPTEAALKVRMRFQTEGGERTVYSCDPVGTMLEVSGWGRVNHFPV